MIIENSPRGYLTAFFRQGRAFTVVAGLILLAGVTYLVTTQPVYEARGSLVVKFGQDARPDAALGEKTDYADADSSARREIIQSYVKIIFSRDLLRNLVNEFGTDRLYPGIEKQIAPGQPPDEAAIDILLDRDLKVAFGQSHVIDISVRNPDAQLAAAFAGRVMDAFARKRTEIYNTPQTDLLRQQIEDGRRKFQAAQQNLQNFKHEAGISDVDEETAQLLREKSELNTLAFAAISEAQARLAELETQETKMRSTYRDDSPMLVRFKKEVDSARADLKSRQNALNPSKNGGADSSLAERMNNVDKRLAYLETRRGEYNDLRQQVKIDEENYLYYLKRGEEARINNLLNQYNITRISVVDRPAVPLAPISPRRNIFLAVTLLAALMAGTGTALLRESLDDRISNPDQVLAAIGVPVLVSFRKEMLQ